jgi:hypothetical protein
VTALGEIAGIDAHGVIESRLMVQAPTASLAGASTPVRIEIRADGVVIAVVSSALLGPAGTPNAGEGRKEP